VLLHAKATLQTGLPYTGQNRKKKLYGLESFPHQLVCIPDTITTPTSNSLLDSSAKLHMMKTKGCTWKPSAEDMNPLENE